MQSYRICIIEDDLDVASYLKTLLEKRADATVLTIADPRTSLAQIETFAPELILSDIEMPGLSGLELLTTLKAQHPEVPVIMMTAHASLDYAVQALRAQADEFFTKPIAPTQLITAVHSLITEHRVRSARTSRKTVLAIGAHPDDVEIGVGGTLAAHRDAGDRVVILTMSRGARGGDAGGREQESMAAADRLGARLFLKDLEDTRIPVADPTVGHIEEVVAEVRPDIVYTHSIHDRHQDHRAVHSAAVVACRSVATVMCFQSPSATVEYQPTRFSPIDEYIETKLELIDCFASQTVSRGYLEHDFVTATARYWSRFGGGKFCEPLEVMKDTSPATPQHSAAHSTAHNEGARA